MANRKQKYYAVREGRKPGIYQSWAECQKNVTGFSGALFKSFETLKEAEDFIGEETSFQDMETYITESAVAGELSEKSPVQGCAAGNSEDGGPAKAVAYVDGSFNPVTNEYAYGAVIFYEGEEQHFSEKFDNPEMSVMRNVAGEIEGAKKAMQYCVDNGIDSLDIYYDYQGIMAWCTGMWKAGKEGTMAYKCFYDSIKDKVNVNFVKVKAHTGVAYNEMADSLAKGALGL